MMIIIIREKIMSLSQEEILRDINTRNISGVLLREKNFTNLLGEIEYSETGDRSPVFTSESC